MAGAFDVAALHDIAPGSHVCWLVDDPAAYVSGAARLLADAARTGEKPIVFGPGGSGPLAELAPLAARAADPLSTVLHGGPLDAEAMFAMFSEQSETAREEGYRRLRVVADMDWLLPLHPTTDTVIGFELLLDRHARQLDATIVCAYRTSSFDTAAINGARCVHPVEAGAPGRPQFRLVADGNGTWRLTGEVDVAVAANFQAALVAATAGGCCVVDVSELEFIDVASMRVIACSGPSPDAPVRLVGAPRVFRRSWALAGFDAVRPGVEFVN